MTPTRRIPASGINLFQLIYVLLREYEGRSGEKALNLSLGNPDLIPFEPIRALKAEVQLRTDYDLHTYAEDKNLGHFCEGICRLFTGLDLARHPTIRAVPIAGIKTATALLPLACGAHLGRRKDFTVVTHLPAYDVMGTWSAAYLGAKRIVWPLSPSSGMRLDVRALRAVLGDQTKPDLVFVIRPGNPAARGASRAEWEELIAFCLERGSRLVNDGAYTTLAPGSGHVALSQVAPDYPELEWMELLSVSKAFSDPGARLGCAVGSKEFIEDFTLIKGNTDSGPVPSLMQAYGELFRDEALARKMLADLLAIYQARLDYLVPRLKSAGLKLACETDAGFFTLWSVPREAYGIDLVAESELRKIPRAELFNRLVIERSGIVGVHFTGPEFSEGKAGEPYIRYAVCTDVLLPEFQRRFEAAIGEIRPIY